MRNPQIEVRWNTEVVSFHGAGGKLNSLNISNNQTGKEEQALKELSAQTLDEVFIKLKLLSFLFQKFIFLLVVLTIFMTASNMLTSQFEMLDKIDTEF